MKAEPSNSKICVNYVSYLTASQSPPCLLEERGVSDVTFQLSPLASRGPDKQNNLLQSNMIFSKNRFIHLTCNDI